MKLNNEKDLAKALRENFESTEKGAKRRGSGKLFLLNEVNGNRVKKRLTEKREVSSVYEKLFNEITGDDAFELLEE